MEALPERATPSLAKDAKRARNDTSDVMRPSHNGIQYGCPLCQKTLADDHSRNCTKHNCRCDYMDQPSAGEEPLKGPPNLLTSAELQASLDQWRLTGACPIPELQTTAPEYWMHFSTVDLRLIHHVATSSIDLQNRGYAQCTSWAPRMPT